MQYIYIYKNPKKTKLRGSKKLVCRLATLQKKKKLYMQEQKIQEQSI